MWMQIAKLEKKISLTHDVSELHYIIPGIWLALPGQFITFILPGIWGRAYSILAQENERIVLIIKRWDIENGGRWGSVLLCDAQVWEEFKCVGPSGHFLLANNTENKLFLGTGTGLVPMYNMIVAELKKDSHSKLKFIFWVRVREDIFYHSEIQNLADMYPDRFEYQIFTSREEQNWDILQGYVTDALDEETLEKYSECYICGAPGMIESSIEKLTTYGVSTENIFFEKYS
jgi:NAD(P)H-flavin reductase